MKHEKSIILSIEDEKDIREAFGVFFRRSGYTFFEAGNGKAGLDLFRSKKPDVVLLDLIMPDVNGFDVLSEIAEESPGTPVIIISASNNTSDVIKTLRLGAFDYLAKPIVGLELLGHVVERAVEKVRLLNENKEYRRMLEKTNNELENLVEQQAAELTGKDEKLESEFKIRTSAENSVRESEEKFRMIFDNANDAIIYLNKNGALIDANKRAFDLFGFSPEDSRGKNFDEFDFLGVDYMQALELYKAANPNISFPLFELEAFRQDGEKLDIEVNSRMIKNNGDVTGIVNIVRDITKRKILEKDILESNANIQRARTVAIMGLAKLAEYRDNDTGSHLERIREYVRILAEGLRKTEKYSNYITPEYITDLYNSSILHDIGKVSTPDAILMKPGKLTFEEFEVIKQHTIVGGNALKAADTRVGDQSFLTLGRQIAYYHHESWNGKGYPEGIKGKDIPLSARIVALADVYDALTSPRVYKEAYSHEKAADIIFSEKEIKFDPDIVDIFFANVSEFKTIRDTMHDDSDTKEHMAVSVN